MSRLAVLMTGALLLVLFFSAQEGHVLDGTVVYGVPLLLAAGSGAAFRLLGRHHVRPMRLTEAAAFAVLSWVYLSLLGALPYLLSGVLPPLSAAFEAVSSFTTTGLSCLDYFSGRLPRSLVLWHALMCYVGGLNFIVLLVTALPQTSACFGLTLSAHQRLFFSPVWRQMHVSIWQALHVYGALTAAFFAAFAAAGMPLFDALLLSLLTISTAGGGAQFQPYAVTPLLLAMMLAMLLSGGNLLLYFKAWSLRSFRLLAGEEELRKGALLLAACGLLIGAHLFCQGVFPLGTALGQGFFTAVSFFTTTGFLAANVQDFPDFDRYLLLLLSFMGGCIGSAAGGIKLVRLLVLGKMSLGEIRRTLHPHMVLSVKIDGLPVPEKVAGRVLSFFFAMMSMLFFGMLGLSAAGLHILPALGLSAGCLTSTGATAVLLGTPPPAALPAGAMALSMLLMLVGRVEIFAFVLFAALEILRLKRSW